MINYLNNTSKQNFKVGDYFYLDRYAKTIKLKPQEIINIKLGIINVLPDTYAMYMRQIISIDHGRLFFKDNNKIEVK